MNLIPIHDITEIDLDSHGVIEASAGTGKTYTIEQLVIALLTRNKVSSLEEILVVTFTDKAAGELKDRIRKIMVESLDNNKSDLLKVSLDKFDTASIYTIHGFCNKILQDYAFENHEQFALELVDDGEIFRKVIRQVMREIWPKRFGQYLYTILKISHYPDRTANGRSQWENRVIDLALRYQPAANDRIIPPPTADIISTILDFEGECNNHLDALNSYAGHIDGQNIQNSDLYLRYSCLNIRKQSIPKRLRIITDILNLLISYNMKISSLLCVSDFLSRVEIGDKGFDELNEGWIKSCPNYADKLPYLIKIVDTLKKIHSMDFATLQNLLAVDTVMQIKLISSDYKTTQGAISYEDMITHVYNSLIRNNSKITKVLQKKFRYALVDEFQDTDIIQWKIFKILFLESDRNKLYIIGDPKQAIYGFRGADLNAYYIARDDMARNYSARIYYLNENWRSTPPLIKAFNGIFADARWFTDNKIQYLPNYFPRSKEPGPRKDSDSLIIINCGTCSGSDARMKTANYIAHEIKQIIKSAWPPIALNEMAILIKKWNEAEALERQLKKANIKYSYYKKEGLYQSKEALELIYLISSITHPLDTQARKKALATRFFNIPINDLHLMEYLSSAHPISRLFGTWTNYAEQKNWAPLFHSIIEDSGIRFRLDIDDYDRMMINYQTILQHINIEAYKCNYRTEEILLYLSRMRSKESYSHESLNLHTIDMEKPGVQIMTIHASKGLEFKVVFIAGGYTRRDVASFWTYHSDNTRIFDLVQNRSCKKQYSDEISSEEERLFYVAFTRAKDRLYIPIFEPTQQSRTCAGILGDKIPLVLNTLRNEHSIKWVDYDSFDFPEANIQKERTASAATCHSLKLPDPLFYEISTNFQNRKVHITSFSQLKAIQYYQEHVQIKNISREEDRVISGNDDAFYSTSSENKRTNINYLHGLPASSTTGLILHEILEKADFQQIKQAKNPTDLFRSGSKVNEIIQSAICKHMKLNSENDIRYLKEDASHMIWHALHTALDGSNLILCDIEKKFHELEFYYPSTLIHGMNIPGVTYASGFIHGFIDMIFLYGGKYYIVDWKSNFLEEGYSYDSIKKNIYDMHYDLQIQLYTAAVKKWLSNDSPNQHFGGVYYIYLRGINRENAGEGIYFINNQR